MAYSHTIHLPSATCWFSAGLSSASKCAESIFTMPFVSEPVNEDLPTVRDSSEFSGLTGVYFISDGVVLLSAKRNLTTTSTLIITANIQVDFDLRALESDDARLLNQPNFPNLGVSENADGSDDLAASEGEVINGSGMSLHFFLYFFDFDFETSPPLEKISSSSRITSLCSAESGFLVPAV